MDEKNINKILEYRRPCDSWLCPECDTENNMLLGKCTVCGCKKDSTVTILKQWTEADEKAGTFQNDPQEKAFPAADEGNNNIIIWCSIIFVIIGIFWIVIASIY